MDRNEKVWAYSNTGMRMHAFVQTIEGGGFKRAVCRSSILRNMDAIFVNWGEAHSVCPRCAKLMEAMYARAEASMQPATEADDLGYVAPVEENVPLKDVAPELPRGTRVVTHTGLTGTVLRNGRGICKITNTQRYGQPYVRVKLDRTSVNRPLLPRQVWFIDELTNLDALHAEALEMDAAETARLEPELLRFYCRALLTSPGGTSLGEVESYLNAIDSDDAEVQLKERFATDLTRLTSVYVTSV